MQFIKNNVVTYCIGQAASMGAFLLLAGTKGKRFALPNSRILIHQPSMGGLSGQATDIDIHAREILRIREITNTLIAQHTGQPLDRIERDVERDFIMNSQQAKEYGIVDEIIDRPRTQPVRTGPEFNRFELDRPKEVNNENAHGTRRSTALLVLSQVAGRRGQAHLVAQRLPSRLHLRRVRGRLQLHPRGRPWGDPPNQCYRSPAQATGSEELPR
jgi:hypothetical protein